jgi:outer membrane protein OmpA-like peptidoglycan-associated protein
MKIDVYRSPISLRFTFCLFFVSLALCASIAAQAQQSLTTQPEIEGRSAMAISYPEGPTISMKFKGTHRAPTASGEAKIERKRGMTEVEIELDEMKPATYFGGDYATYVLWVVSPEGQVDNIGEFILRGNRSKLNVSTPQQTFALFVTAEPHFLTSTPSRFVVLENTHPKNHLTGQMLKISTIKYRGYDGAYNYRQETLVGDPEAKGETRSDVRQAVVAVKLAERAGAEQFARTELEHAREALKKTLDADEANVDPKQLMVLGHETVRLSVEAEKFAVERSAQAALDNERSQKAQEISSLKKSAEQAQIDADRTRLEAEKARLEEQRRTEEAARLAAAEARKREEAEAKAAALSQAQTAAALEAERIKRERDEARGRLQSALSKIVETRVTVRGLIVNLPDILFDVDRATLKPQARETLSKVCGVLQVAGENSLSIEGHTDSTGSDEHNQSLSERRAKSVSDYLASCGLPGDHLLSKGFGEQQPLETNDTAQGRQRNRRVEIVIQEQKTAAVPQQ